MSFRSVERRGIFMVKKVSGVCKLCGKYKKLTFEHVPPQKAFNSFPVKVFSPAESLKIMSGQGDRKPWETDGLQGRIQQGGSGGFYLCEDCNNKSGAWYAREYVDFTKKVHSCISACNRNRMIDCGSFTLVLKDIYPLRILKAIMVMFCDIYEGCFGDEKLRTFLLNKRAKGFDMEKYSLFLYLTGGPRLRKLPLQYRFMPGYGLLQVLEISQYPLGLLLFINKPETFQPPGIDISNFARFDYDAHCNYRLFKIPVLKVNTPFVLDYRSKEEVIVDEKGFVVFPPQTIGN